MTEPHSSLTRIEDLISRLLDGTLSADESTGLQQRLLSDSKLQERLVNQLLLDSLLSEELGTDSVTALVDLVSDSGIMAVISPKAETDVTRSRPASRRRFKRVWKLFGWLSVAAVIVVSAFSLGRLQNSAFADAATIVRAAAERHAEPVERVYLVEVERPSEMSTELMPTRDVRVATQGDRFYVEMNRGQREWFWGRDAEGAIWLTAGPRRAIVVQQDELGVPLQYISDLYTLNLETLLSNFLKHCRLDRNDVSDATHVITATPRYRWRGGWVRKATIEVDRETKAVRRLIIERELPQQGPSTVTFTLIETRPADESKYSPEGHLTEPFRLLSRGTQPDSRRELMTNWFGPAADRWIKTKETQPQ